MSATVLTRNLRETFQLRDSGPLAWPGARAFLAMLVPLLVLLQLDRLELVPGVVFGALTSVYCRTEPYRSQTRMLAAVAIAMVLAVTIGDLIAAFGGSGLAHDVLALSATAVVGGVATATATAVRLGSPGGLIFAFATGACAHLPLSPSDLGVHVAATAASAAFAWAVNSTGSVISGLRPQRRVVAAALRATAEYSEAASDEGARHRATVAVDAALHSVAQVGRRHRETREHRELVLLSEACDELLTTASGRVSAADLRDAATEVAAGREITRFVPQVTEPGVAPTPVSRWPAIRAFLSAVARPNRYASTWLWPYAGRVALAVLLAGVLAVLLEIGHSYWAAVSAVSVLQATSVSKSVPRMAQRVSGTVVGVLLGLGILYAQLPVWVIVVLLAVLQCCAELTVVVNYSFGLTFATPVALLVGSMANPIDPTTLALHRLWATLLGAAIAVGVALSLPNRAWHVRVRKAIRHVGRLGTEVPVRPDTVRSALIELHEAHDLAAGEMRQAKIPSSEVFDASRHGYRLLDRHARENGRCHHHRGDSPLDRHNIQAGSSLAEH